ncbi:MAG: phosphatidylserine/phosphatidylglycerophosphate/cardiolipin synthase family protein [Candidatus Sericytochromatia bacterium]|nr:phosphatidylserine/phosphatidylglycerophosphate/cardiolipin synthase family protein [Candidatus Sericytochromatia bacterium]
MDSGIPSTPATTKPTGNQPSARFAVPSGRDIMDLYKAQKAAGAHPLRTLVRGYDRDRVATTLPSFVTAGPPGKGSSFKNPLMFAIPGVQAPEPAKGLTPLHGAAANTMALTTRSVGRVTTGNQVQLYVDGAKAYPALEKLIRSAKHTLYIETMSWSNDSSGNQIAHAIVAAHKRGVDVKIVVDSIGLNLNPNKVKDNELMAWMRSQGVDVQVFNPNIVTKDGVALNHQKLYIADNERYLSGGMNVGNHYAHEWHDMMFEVSGPAAHTVAKEFAVTWSRTTGNVLEIPPAKPQAKVPGNAAVGIAVTDPIGRRYELKRANLQMIHEAKHHIQMEMPYNSDDDLMGALRDAARRGVKVDFIMPTMNDIPSYVLLNKAEAQDLIKAGVNVRFYDGGTIDGKPVARFSHLKMMIFDDTVAVVGSANADHRSYRDNNELNAYIADPAFVNTLATEVFATDWQASRVPDRAELKPHTLKGRITANAYRLVDRLF